MKANLLMLFFALVAVMTSCTKDTCDETTVSDETLCGLAISSNDFTYMRSVSQGDVTWKIKMNDVASKAYSEGSKYYPVNSMIVKEKYDASGKITGYDIKYKAPADNNSIDGWLWSEVSGDGHVIYNAQKKGTSCQGCHATMGMN